MADCSKQARPVTVHENYAIRFFALFPVDAIVLGISELSWELAEDSAS